MSQRILPRLVPYNVEPVFAMVALFNKDEAQMTDQPKLISLNDACHFTSLSRTAINRYRSEGRFPQAVSLGEKRIAFVRDEVVSWIDSRIDARQRERAR